MDKNIKKLFDDYRQCRLNMTSNKCEIDCQDCALYTPVEIYNAIQDIVEYLNGDKT